MNQIPAKPSHDQVQLVIWPCAQQTDQQQRHGRYLPDPDGPPQAILPELARRAIGAYSRPGDLVLDPACGTGTTLVEAVHLERRAIGIEPDNHQAALARANLQNANAHGATARGQAICGDPDDLVKLLAHHARHLLRAAGSSVVAALPYGRVDLVITSLTGIDSAVADKTYAAWARTLKPGGFVVLVVDHSARDRLGATIGACEAIGLQYRQHLFALRTPIHDDELIFESVLVFRRQHPIPRVAAVSPECRAAA